VKDRYIPSLSVAGVLLAQGLDYRAVRSDESGLHVAGATIPLVDQTISDYSARSGSVCRGLLSFRGPRLFEGRATFDEYSFYDLFEAQLYFDSGDVPEERRGKLIEPSVFKDKIVVVGTNAASLFDVFVSPFLGQFPGPLVHANAIDALLDARAMAPSRASTGLVGTAAVALIVGLSGAVLSPWALAGVAAVLSGAIVWASVSWFAQGLWTPLVQPLLAVALAFVGQLSWQYFVEGREKRQVKKLFSRYVPKDVYEQLMADPNRAALGGRRRTMTVLFSDVRGFTAMSEKATPEEVVGQLNEYFSRMVQVLFEHRGTLDKFVGDMVMGLFGAPLDDPDHAEHAVQTAIAMSRALDELNREWGAAGRPQLDIGIGISTGEMVAGNIGSEAIMSYTVIGDRVNLGARLESLNKEYGTRIIISDATREALKGRYDIHPLGEVVVKGKSRSVAIYEVKPT
jgi:adenylate cyclase